MFTTINKPLFTFVNMISLHQLSQWYSYHFEDRLFGRYICLNHIDPILQEYDKLGIVSEVGFSERGSKISVLQVGNGPKKVLAWSQMHGNESTTTKAIFDFLKFIVLDTHYPKEIEHFLSTYSFYVIPILNPDGALDYTRENSNGIDLNRDALNLTQKESRILRMVFNEVKPDMCLNLHDQRTLYSLPNNKPATLSFLAPAADSKLTITDSRKIAMLAIANINKALQELIPGQIGRYDDTFNANCVGDTFQSLHVPTLLFEAGHSPGDYPREITRKYVFISLLALFNLVDVGPAMNVTLQDYYSIPENDKNFRDVILRNSFINNKIMDIVIQFQEKLVNAQINFVPVIEELVPKSSKIGHKEIDLNNNKILINSHENVFVNEEIATISYKNLKKPIIF